MALEKAGVILTAAGYQEYMSQLRNINKAHKETFSKQHVQGYNKEMKKTTKVVRDVKKQAGGLGGAFKAMGSGDIIGGLGKLRKMLLSIKAAVPMLLALAGVAKAVQKLVSFGKAASEIAARNETLRVSLVEMGTQYGYTIEQIDYATDQLKNQGITTTAAQESLLRMARANIEWSEASELARIAQASAVTAGMNSSEAFNRLVTGIQKMEPELLDELGITLQRGKAYEKLAATLGKSSKDLSQQEKQQAILNEVYAQSEKVLGVYDAAMETAGKQQGSLARHIEETQQNLGAMLLPLKSVSIQMKTEFWKGARLVTRGLASWGPIIDKTVKALLGLKGDTSSVFDFIGKTLHNAARTFVLFSAMVGSALGAASQSIGSFLSGAGAALDKLTKGDFAGAKEAFKGMGDVAGEFSRNFQENMTTSFTKAKEEFPDLFKSWEELGEVAYAELDRTNSAMDDNIAKLEEQKAALEKQIEVLARVEDIQRNYEKGLKKAADQYAKNLAKAEKDLEKSLVKAAKSRDKKLASLVENATKQRKQLQEEGAKKQVQDARKLHKDLEMEQKRFELSQVQGLRRFKLAEKRAMAEGDVLAVMQMREDFALQQQEAKENHNLSKQEQKDTAEETARQQREDMQTRLEELDQDIRDRRQEVQDSYREEVDDLVASNQERKTEMTAAYMEQLDGLKQSRRDQLEELGRALQQEGEMTKEGMDAIAGTIAEVFGDQGAGEALIKGWAERSTTAMSGAMEEIRAQIVAVETEIQNIQTETAPEPEPEDPTTGGVGTRRRRPRARGRRRGMRAGGIGVVTGPALFEVEPGVQEVVAFAPVSQGARSGSLDVNVGGGIDVRGAEGASPAIVEASVQMTMLEIQEAVKRMSRRK